jgi:uncharacterized protein
VSEAPAFHDATETMILRCRATTTLWQRFRGLMAAPLLPAGEGLWFPDCAAVHTAFVRGAIDLVFLKQSRIVKVCPGVLPWRIALCPGADSVVELRSGEARRLGLALGRRLEIETTSLQAGRPS